MHLFDIIVYYSIFTKMSTYAYGHNVRLCVCEQYLNFLLSYETDSEINAEIWLFN